MLEIQGLEKHFGNLHVLKGIDLKVEKGEVVVVIGPSGTGKSTLLRCINLLEKPDRGIIKINDISFDVNHHSSKDEQKLRRKTAMVFQNYCLFKNKTVLENILLPMTLVRKINKKNAVNEAFLLLEKVGLLNKKDEFPSRLSGGQQQRIGIARALAVRPEIILFDEPTSSLDPELVNGILEIIRDLAEEHSCSMIIVTHEMRFAMSIADKIVFMDNGLILEQGTPEEIIKNAKHDRTKKFLEIFQNQ